MRGVIGIRIPSNLLALCALFFLGALQAHEAQAQSSQPVTCRAEPAADTSRNAPHLAGICAALNARPELQSLSPDLQLALVIETMTDSHLTARLEWRTPQGPGQSPRLDFGFLDTGLSPDQYGFVVNGLINALNLP